MPHSISLTAARRATLGKHAAQLRRQGLIPGILYGYNVQEPIPVEIDQRTFEHIYRRAGANTLVELHIGDGGPATQVFIHQVTRHPVHHQLTHVDFRAVNLNKPITADIELVLNGEAPAVKTANGMVLQMLNTLHVRALPAHLPAEILVDLSTLTEIGQALHVRDLTLPGDVEVMTDPDMTIVQISAQHAEPEEEVAEAEAEEAEAEEGAEGDENAS